jgi:predicted restriction endonuclease
LTKNKFCSKSCATAYHNRISPKKEAVLKTCSFCGETFKGQRTYHKECFEQKFYNDYETLTLRDFEQRPGSKNSHDTIIRANARSIALRLGKLKKCAICSYDLNVECCHIKAVSAFSEDTVIAVVNAPENLIGLCPNHHWELDNGYLQLK